MATPEENKALVRRFYEEIDKGNIDAMDDLVAEDYPDHSPPPFPGLVPGREGLKQAFRMFWDSTPGYHRIDDQIAEGDKVVTRLTGVGRHEGDLPGAPRTGNDMEMTATVIHRARTTSSWRNGRTRTSSPSFSSWRSSPGSARTTPRAVANCDAAASVSSPPKAPSAPGQADPKP